MCHMVILIKKQVCLAQSFSLKLKLRRVFEMLYSFAAITMPDQTFTTLARASAYEAAAPTAEYVPAGRLLRFRGVVDDFHRAAEVGNH